MIKKEGTQYENEFQQSDENKQFKTEKLTLYQSQSLQPTTWNPLLQKSFSLTAEGLQIERETKYKERIAKLDKNVSDTKTGFKT